MVAGRACGILRRAGPDGDRWARVRKALITPLRERWKVDVVDHEYEIEVEDRKIAEVSKKWFRVRDAYGVEIARRAGAIATRRTDGVLMSGSMSTQPGTTDVCGRAIRCRADSFFFTRLV
ncbi:MAG TPA: hypothetical protein VNT27_08625 [Propionibacteriaceae bacterium]|nr:hypothetical protein [Propionibacteriaceae bacterium]